MGVSCFDLLDRHVVAGRAEHAALRETSRTWTYARLLEEVASFGGVLHHCGVRPGDPVVVSLPVSAEQVVALLACARVGAEHRRVAEGGEKVLVTASTEGDVVAGSTAAVVLVKQRPDAPLELREDRDYDWDVVMRAGRTAPAPWVEDALVTPWDEPTRTLLGPLLTGDTIHLPT